MPRRVLALDLGMHTLRAAVLESSLREGVGVQLAQLRRDPDQPLAAQIQELCTDLVSAGTSGMSVVSCLPGDVVCQRFLSLPFSRPQQIGQVVPFELENLIPFSVDEVVVDFQIVEHTPEGVRVLAVAVPSQTLAEHLATLTAAGLDPSAVGLAPLQPLACVRLAQQNQQGQPIQPIQQIQSDLLEQPVQLDSPDLLDLTGVVGILDIGQTQTSLAVMQGEQLCGVRTLQTGLGQVGGLAAFLQELRWTLLSLCQTAAGAALVLPSRFFLSGGGAYISQLRTAVAQAFGAQVVPFQQLSLPGVSASDREKQALFATCLGLGLPEILGQSEPVLNLRQGAFGYQGQRQILQQEWSRLGWLAAGVAAAAGLAFAIDLYRLDTRYDLLRHEIRQAFSETLPEVHTIVNEKIQLQDAVASLQKRQRVFQAETRVSPLEILRQLSTALPQKTTLDLDEWVFDGKMIRLRGTTDSFDAAESIKTATAGLGAFREVQLKDVKAIPGGKKVSFQLHGLVDLG